jgi:hypothetical protein
MLLSLSSGLCRERRWRHSARRQPSEQVVLGLGRGHQPAVGAEVLIVPPRSPLRRLARGSQLGTAITFRDLLARLALPGRQRVGPRRQNPDRCAVVRIGALSSSSRRTARWVPLPVLRRNSTHAEVPTRVTEPPTGDLSASRRGRPPNRSLPSPGRPLASSARPPVVSLLGLTRHAWSAAHIAASIRSLNRCRSRCSPVPSTPFCPYGARHPEQRPGPGLGGAGPRLASCPSQGSQAPGQLAAPNREPATYCAGKS